MKKFCDHCGEPKEEDQFNWKFKALGVRHNTCRECMKIHQKKYFSGPAHDRHLEQVRERKEEARKFARDFVYNYCSVSEPVRQMREKN